MKSKIALTENQWRKISDISGNIGLLVVGSVIIPFLLNNIELFEIIKAVVVAIFLWYISIIAAGKYHD